MKIVLPGGSGQIGSMLTSNFSSHGHDIVILTRAKQDAIDEMNPDTNVRWVYWDGQNDGPWCQEIDGADVVINLAGRSVNCRLNQKTRRQIMDSRVHSTRAVGQAILAAISPPAVWLNSSTATIYPHTLGPAHSEKSTVEDDATDMPSSWRFSVDVGKAWEAAATEFDLPSTRLVIMRQSITMSPDSGGIFDVLMGLVRKRLGGRNGSGKQFVSWIHYRDFVRAIDWIIQNSELSGPVNLASPNPLSNAEFMADIRRVAGIRFGLPAPQWLLEIGAVFMKTETELILKSRRVIPTKLLDSGFRFDFPLWADAASSMGSA